MFLIVLKWKNGFYLDVIFLFSFSPFLFLSSSKQKSFFLWFYDWWDWAKQLKLIAFLRVTTMILLDSWRKLQAKKLCDVFILSESDTKFLCRCRFVLKNFFASLICMHIRQSFIHIYLTLNYLAPYIVLSEINYFVFATCRSYC